MDDLVKRLAQAAEEYGNHLAGEAKCRIEAQAAEIAALRAQAERDWVTPLLRWTEYNALYLVGIRIAIINEMPWGLEATIGETWRTIKMCADDTEAEARAAVESAVRKALGVKPAAAVEPLKQDKGHKGGSCNRTCCQAPGAWWFNHSTEKYYCTACALDLNQLNRRDAFELYGHDLCRDESPAPPASEPARTCETCAHDGKVWTRILRDHPCAPCKPPTDYPNWTPKTTDSEETGA